MNAYERFTCRLAGEPVDRPPNFDIFMTFAAHYIGQPLSHYYLDHRVLVDANLAMVEAFNIDLVQAISDPYREACDLGLQVDFPEDALPVAAEPLLSEPGVGAITAARAGLRVTLIQDRPVLGGNASSEVRLWILGATSHMGNNNRWAREGGVIDEILVENMYRNPDGNPLTFDTILLEKVVSEPGITLLLNTAGFEADKSAPDTIQAVRAFCSQNSTLYEVHAPLFCDASGDGILGFLSGAAFRMGAESADEFGEKMAPSQEYGELLGHTLYFYSKDVGRPVRFIPPSFALDDITQIPRFRSFNAQDYGCHLWSVYYTHLTLPTIYYVQTSVVADSLKKKNTTR